jgi:alpha-galactosidase
MLEVGNGLTESQNRAHFTMWSMIAAPLIAGNDIRKMAASTNAILTNKDVIAVNQDPLGIQALKYAKADSLETWIKPLANGDWVICFLNRKTTPQEVLFDWNAQTIDDPIAKRTLDAKTTTYNLRDIWAKKDLGNTKKPLKLTVAAQDVVLVRLVK